MPTERRLPPQPPPLGDTSSSHHSGKHGFHLHERSFILFLKQLKPLGNQSPHGWSKEDAGKGY